MSNKAFFDNYYGQLKGFQIVAYKMEEEEDEVQVQVDAAAVHHSMANERIQPSITVSA